MPETIRAANERLRSRPRRGGLRVAVLIANFCWVTVARADADSGVADTIDSTVAALAQPQLANLTLTLGLLIFAVLATIALLRTRKAADRAQAASRDQAMERNAEIDRLK